MKKHLTSTYNDERTRIEILNRMGDNWELEEGDTPNTILDEFFKSPHKLYISTEVILGYIERDKHRYLSFAQCSKKGRRELYDIIVSISHKHLILNAIPKNLKRYENHITKHDGFYTLNVL